MGSHRTGSDELLYIETDKLRISMKGRTPAAWMVKDGEAEFRLYSDDAPKEVILSGEEQEPRNHVFRTHPTFYEQNRYELLVEGPEGHVVSVNHVNLSIRSAITPVGHHENMVSGIINFRNDIGYSDFVVSLDGVEALRFTVEVFPEKISYRKDYQAILLDVTTELYSLVFDFLRTTYTGFRQGDVRCSSPVEFFAVISRIYDRFLRSVDKVIREPHHVLKTRREIMPAYRAKRCDHQSIRWLMKHGDHGIRKGENWLVDRIPAVSKHISYDTRENRLTRFMIQSTIRRLQTFRKRYGALYDRQDEDLLRRMDGMVNRLNRRITGSFLSEVEPSGESAGLSLVFMMAPGYRDLYKYYLMLERGLNLTGDVFHLSVKDLAQLYEYWCFIKLNSLLKGQYRLISQDIIRTEGTKLFTTLVKGGKSSVRYRNPVNGESIVLSYNPTSAGLPTVPQKPDNVLTLTKNGMDGGDLTYKYIFDAKYKMDPAVEGSYYYNCVSHFPGPREEDINTMHRYRDAIVSEERENFYERTMFGTYVLFPYNKEEEYKNHRFYKSIDDVNIGGLPSATTLVKDMLDELVSDSPETAFERSLLPVGIERRLAKVDWSRRDVLVGVLKNRQQLDVCRKYHFYHIPASRVGEEHLPIHYVAIYQSRRLFGKESGIFLYGEVTKCTLLRRREIRELPKDSEALYYRFDVKSWKKLPRPIGVREGAQVALFTNRFLLLHSTKVPDLLIRSEEEFRLYYELKRLAGGSLEENPSRPLCCRFGSCLLDYEKGEVRVIRDGRICRTYPAEKIIRRPYAYFGEIKRKLGEV